MASKEVTTPTDVTLVAVRKALTTKTKLPAQFTADDPEQVAAEIEARTLNARNLGELMAANQDPQNIDTVLGRTIEVTHVAWRNGDFDSIYAVIDGLDIESNTPVKLSTGSANALQGLLKLCEFGALPFLVEFNKATKPTRGGFVPYNMRLIGQRVGEVEPF